MPQSSVIDERIAERERQSLAKSIEEKIAARDAERKENPGSAFSEFVGRSLVDNILSLPNLAALGAAAVQAPFSERGFSDIFQEEKQKFPANLSTNINEVGAFARSLPELLTQRPADREGVENPVPLFTERFGSRFDEELGNLNAEEQRMRDRFPNATGFGDLGGDIASLFVGRAPFLKSIDSAEAFLAGKKFADAVKNPGAAGEVGNIVRTVLDSAPTRSLMRGTGRAAESGVEGLVLEAINGDDPLKAAAYAAGGQAIGSVLLSAVHGRLGGKGIIQKGLRVAGRAAAIASLIQVVRTATPGGTDSPIQSIEEAFDHMVLLLLAGGAAAVAGAGRLRGGEFDKTYPILAETLSTLPRASTISLLTDYVEASPDEQQIIDDALEQMQKDPEFFGPEISEKLLKGIEDGTLIQQLREEL